MMLNPVAIAPDHLLWPEFKLALNGASLPHDDLGDVDQHFFAFTSGGVPCAFGGLFLSGPDALLRSIVVMPDNRGLGSGASVVAMLGRWAKAQNVKRLWLLTTVADAFFERQGFSRMDRLHTPKAIAATREFSTICPSSAVLMCQTLV